MAFFSPLASCSWLARSGCLRTPLLLLLACLTAAGPARAQEMPPRQQWDKTLGGSTYDELHALLVTPGGGYLLAGTSASPAGGDKSENGPGGSDYWVVKIDGNGNKQWDKTFGGTGNDVLAGVAPGADGGYLLAGTSDSPAGGDKRENGRGGNDYWVVKIDSSGAKVWDKTFGGSNAEALGDLVAAPDGGYLLGGTSHSGKGGDKSEDGRGDSDYWLVKLNGEGNLKWDKTLGSGGADDFSALTVAGDGGYLAGGSSWGSAGGDKSEDHCSRDYWVVKTDGAGNKQWDRTLNSDDELDVYCSDDYLRDVVLADDGGFLLGGVFVSDDYSRSWVVKIDAGGNRKWTRFFGQTGSDNLDVMAATKDGFVLGGSIWIDTYWLVKMDRLGNSEWEKTLGGSSSDILSALVAAPDGGYLLGGTSHSGKSGDKSEDSRGDADYWAVKLGPAPSVRVNAGGGAYTSARGKGFMADRYATAGRPATPVANDIARTDDDALYRQGRVGERFTYRLPTGNGVYYVVLHFAETYWGHTVPGGAGSRRFNVDVEEARKLTDYDIFSRAGGSLSAVQEAFRVVVRDSVLDIRFSRGTADLPLVSAIEVFPQENFKINVAGPAHFSSRQGWYLSDFYGSGGTLSQYAPGEVALTDDDELYRSNRHGSLFNYNLPTGPGTFRVTLHFNETYWGNLVPGGAGSRRFNVNAEGQRMITGYDTHQGNWGAMRARQEQLYVTVSDQILNLAFLIGSADQSVDFAHVAAIEVVKLPPSAATAARRTPQAAEPAALPSIRLYPNPVSHTLTIQLPFPAGRVKTAAIRNATGRVLLTNGSRKAGENQLQWDVSSLGQGLYLLSVESDGECRTFRFFKQ